MKHTSIRLNSPIEFINLENTLNPLISKCQIKVCYVGDEPNRNGSIITKETAIKMAPSLRGCPIVGFYNEATEDFEEHNRNIKVTSNEWEITDATVPYGFVDINAKVWFEKFLDDNETEHEYLVTEGYIWTHAYPEAKRILEKGNNQSMELDPDSLDGSWTKDENGDLEFFIINEALISKLCILGEDFEPCFEGAQITNIQFSFESGFKEKLFSMMDELKTLIKKGGVEVSVEQIVSEYLVKTYPDDNDNTISKYSVSKISDENFAVIQDRQTSKLYRLDFSFSDTNEFVPNPSIQEFSEDNSSEATSDENDSEVEGDSSTEFVEDQEKIDEKEEICPKCGKPISECTCKQDENKYILNEIPEYLDLTKKYAEAKQTIAQLNEELNSLRQFKLTAERKDKEEMISRFYMLSDEDKEDVVKNIDTYSLDDIEAKLSVICVRKRINFAEEEQPKGPTTFNLDTNNDNDTPAWVKAALNVAKTLNN